MLTAATRRAGVIWPVFSIAGRLPIPDRRPPGALNINQIISSEYAFIDERYFSPMGSSGSELDIGQK